MSCSKQHPVSSKDNLHVHPCPQGLEGGESLFHRCFGFSSEVAAAGAAGGLRGRERERDVLG